MKLYATTTSERATKGQGGNKFLEVELLAQINGVNTVVGNIKMTTEEIRFYGGDYDIFYKIDTTKDKKQKTVKCKDCENSFDLCPQCWENKMKDKNI